MTLQRSTRGSGWAIRSTGRCARRSVALAKRSSPYMTLLPAGFSQPACLHAAGALLPHLFTLTLNRARARDSGRCSFCATFRRVAPPGCYPAPLPCGVRTFLESIPTVPEGREGCSRGNPTHSPHLALYTIPTPLAIPPCPHPAPSGHPRRGLRNLAPRGQARPDTLESVSLLRTAHVSEPLMSQDGAGRRCLHSSEAMAVDR